MREHKIVVLGSAGAGKSTLVRAIADGVVIDTDVANSDHGLGKAATTVAMDYADVALPNGDRLRLYGTPGQQRFGFIWPILLQGASGAVLLADASLPDPVEALAGHLYTLRTHAPHLPAVVGLSKPDLAPQLDLDHCSDAIAARLRALPVVPMDARDREQVLWLVDALMGEIEAHAWVDADG
jgi:small GTP-binding protein